MINHTSVYSMPGTCFFDLAPAAGGEPYRIFLSIPAERPPAGGWPLLVMTDGNATFPFAAASSVTQAPYPTGTNVGWGVIAAIGYPSDEPYDPLRRSWDLGPPPVKSYPPFVEGGPPVVIGGTGKLVDFIENELIPRIAEMVILDPMRRSLFGHSFGGLFTLYALFERPGLFANWIAASPTIYWENSEILKNEAQRQDAPGNAPFLHLSAGEYEGDQLAPFQYRNEDAPARLEKRKTERTVLLAREMAERLNGTADGVRTEFELYAGETHMSVLAAAVNRAVSIAFAVQSLTDL
ncbi:alpha/beta hydrolase [Rhizobium ruizarguesonis]|uniref:alpha/beta hydrolase n=1 Tax=Rhizobium ruizarguesonis TaxID=2081791 RepID=UPI0010322638|nr:alpha/beta hydrolase-fold protein [Rhizobium ruizarguesonis]NEI06734.1 prolyl oligopeptidase family serine peptidase [Rhizobium ruizarguesonis]NEI27118.1 prolyl oligopeptidase family serine peptidase [Rhizobium ruizarguesonis]TBA31212.1 alpha/beta hydrolase [Rhizobium ruizarguesonis]TBA31510.1 alpha/beta hydrolase [Rhizobium ruizarguesonis]TBB92658.1 alpha/beta hydrolase [Rhizobium ruizarguesonis]